MTWHGPRFRDSKPQVTPVPFSDFEHNLRLETWRHPETGVEIFCEDMPEELLP